MSTGTLPSRQTLERRLGQDIIYCHQCDHQWYRNSQDTSPPPPCPRCGSEAVETVSVGNDPRQVDLPGLETLIGIGDNHLQNLHAIFHHHGTGHLHDDGSGLHDDDDYTPQLPSAVTDHMRHEHLHHTTASQPIDDSDPDEADINNLEQETYDPNGVYMYRSVSSFPTGRRSGNGFRRGATGRQAGGIDPSDPNHIFNAFGDIMNNFRTVQTGRSGRDTLFGSDNQSDREASNPGTVPGAGIPGMPVRHVHRTTFSGPHVRGSTTSFTIATGPIQLREGQPNDFNTIFSDLLNNVGPPVFAEGERPTGIPPTFPAVLRGVLASLLGTREGVVVGDAVHSDEALDRIISMLMETNPASSGAPPASQRAIDHLERKKVDNALLGPEGHAECTICISGVELDEEVLSLPCKHWFHEECVVMWLTQHNTCPVCRNPVETPRTGAQATSSSTAAENHRPNNDTNSSTSNAGNTRNNSAWAPSVFASRPSGGSATGTPGTRGLGSGSVWSAQTGPRGPLPIPAGYRSMTEDGGRQSNRYRSPRDSERVRSDRRRRDSHSPHPEPSLFSNRRYDPEQGRNLHDAFASGREDPSSTHNRPWSLSSRDNTEGAQTWRADGDQARRRWDWSPERSQTWQESLRPPGAAQERDHSSQIDPFSGTPINRPTSWMPSRRMDLGGDGTSDEGGGPAEGRIGATTSNTGSSGGLFGFLNRFRDSSNSQPPNSRRQP